MLNIRYEGLPTTGPVNPNTGVIEAGNLLGLIPNTADASEEAFRTLWIGSLANMTAIYGISADGKNTVGTLRNLSVLPILINSSGQRLLGDESLFNQPGYGNPLPLFPPGTVPTSTLLPDETQPSNRITAYTIGGEYGTDIYNPNATFVPGTAVYSDNAGRLSDSVNKDVNSPKIGVCTDAPSTYKTLLYVKLMDLGGGV